MKTIEITKENIQAMGNIVGKSIRGKGTEIIAPSHSFFYGWGLSQEKISGLREKLEDVEIEKLFIQEAVLRDGRKFYFKEDVKASEKVFNLEKELKNGFESFKSIYIHYKPKVVGYFPISKYGSAYSEQIQMLEDFKKQIEGLHLFGEIEDSDWELLDNCKVFEYYNGSDSYWNGDYHLIHGETIAEDTGDCEYVDGRLDNWNDSAVDNFWLGDFSSLDEIDPDENIAVYHRKGKDWYIGYSLHGEDFILTYRDTDGELMEEEYQYGLFYKEDKKLLDKVVGTVKGWKNDVEVDCYTNNFVEEHWSICELFFENGYHFKSEIQDFISDWNYENIAEKVQEAYYKVISENITILEDFTVVIKHRDFKGKVTEQNYNQLKLIKRLEKALDFKLVYSEVYGSSISSYAIKKYDEEYHFNIAEVIANEISIRSFIQEALAAIEKRNLEKIKEKELMEKASHVFVGIDDSLQAGNCQVGTQQFINRVGINTSKIGGIRGDELLKLENSAFTKRAVMQALVAHGGLAS